MINVEKFVSTINNGNLEPFFTGVPDSLLQPLCNHLMQKYGISKNHIIAANEGCCVGLAAGYYLSTREVPVVYLQNSGIGNIINPVASLLHDKVYGIPCVFIVGWRGEPGFSDEPQHVYQGEVTIQLLKDMSIDTFVISKETTCLELENAMDSFFSRLNKGKSVAFIVRKGALQYDEKVEYKNGNVMKREDVIEKIIAVAKQDIVVATTGRASRELFELRVKNGCSHKHDFLTVGSMGHSASIAAGIAMVEENRKIWCIDGDGALLMHMGAMALMGSSGFRNVVHICINNCAHETVGGMPTIADKIDFVQIAKGCGYDTSVCVENEADLEAVLASAKQNNSLAFIEVKTALGSRNDLGRPTTTPKENKEQFMSFLREKQIIMQTELVI